MRLIKKISDFYWDTRSGFKRLWEWLPVIWRDRHWDPSFTYRLLRHKLELQATYLERNDRHEEVEEDLLNIRKCADLLKKIDDDWYFEEGIKSHEEKWGETEIDFSTGFSFKNPNAHNEEEQAQADHERMDAYVKSEHDKELAIIEVFDIIARNIEYWWD